MISINGQSKIYVATESIDFRKGILGIKSYCSQILNKNPQSGAFFIFKNKSRTSIKILVYDGQGFWLMMKRLSRGKFPWWPSGTTKGVDLDHKKLQLIINAALETQFSEDWKKLF
jgi:transposase